HSIIQPYGCGVARVPRPRLVAAFCARSDKAASVNFTGFDIARLAAIGPRHPAYLLPESALRAPCWAFVQTHTQSAEGDQSRSSAGFFNHPVLDVIVYARRITNRQD